MKRASFLFLLLTFFAAAPLFAQETPVAGPKPTMKIDGTGEIKVEPDLAVMSMTVKATAMDFNQAVKELNKKVSQLNKKLQDAGFKKEEIKTSQLNVQENGHWRNGNYVDSGFVASQFIELKFKRDSQRIARLMEAFIQDKGAEALFHFGFALSDEARQQANEELIRRAIQDARNKATVIARTAGIKLGKIRNIVYGQPNYQPVPMYKEAMQMSARGVSDAAIADMEVQEIEMQDTITIFWEMEQ